MGRAHAAELGFGTWPLGGHAYGRVDEAEARAALSAASENGIRFFDTADIYGAGRVERLIGDVLGGQTDTTVVTKGGYLSEEGATQSFAPEHLEAALLGSLRRLQLPTVDLYLLHSPPVHILESGQVSETMEGLVRRGLALRWGVSLRSVSDFDVAARLPGCAAVEVILNLLDQRPIDSGLTERCATAGIQVIARLPLCCGLLGDRYTVGAEFPPDDRRARWSRRQLDAWLTARERFRYLARSGRSMAQAALAFCLSVPGVTHVIPGMKSVAQVRHNAEAIGASARLRPDEYADARHAWVDIRDLPPNG